MGDVSVCDTVQADDGMLIRIRRYEFVNHILDAQSRGVL